MCRERLGCNLRQRRDLTHLTRFLPDGNGPNGNPIFGSPKKNSFFLPCCFLDFAKFLSSFWWWWENVTNEKWPWGGLKSDRFSAGIQGELPLSDLLQTEQAMGHGANGWPLKIRSKSSMGQVIVIGSWSKHFLILNSDQSIAPGSWILTKAYICFFMFFQVCHKEIRQVHPWIPSSFLGPQSSRWVHVRMIPFG